jgi:tRNA-2-methylthio-N6-dimethylallyladenosine synthase
MGKKSGKEFWVYFTSPHPRDMTDEVIEVIAEYPNLAKQIHIPVQSGDDKVLMRMNRKYTVDDFRKIMNSIRTLLPEATVFTDIIVGFSGETEEQFENTREIMDEFRFNMAYIAQYSVRPGSTSSKWEDDVTVQIKKQRFHKLTDDLMRVSFEKNKEMLDKTYRVLVRGKERNQKFLAGLTEGKINVRIPATDDSLIGKIIDIKINAATEFSVAGEIVI